MHKIAMYTKFLDTDRVIYMAMLVLYLLCDRAL